MSKIDEIRGEMVKAMKAKDKPRKEAISSLVSAVKKAANTSYRRGRQQCYIKADKAT